MACQFVRHIESWKVDVFKCNYTIIVLILLRHTLRIWFDKINNYNVARNLLSFRLYTYGSVHGMEPLYLLVDYRCNGQYQLGCSLKLGNA